MPDSVWSEQHTSPEAIDGALRQLVHERHTENGGLVPARTLNMVAIVDRDYSGEIANRLRGVGRYQASRLIVLAFEPRREYLDARVTVASEDEPAPGEVSLMHETVIAEVGQRHIDDIASIVDPLVITDVPTLLWAPHGHHEAIDALSRLGQAVLLDSAAEPVWRDALDEALRFGNSLYVVDLAWVRPAPWRERIAAAFARAPRSSERDSISQVQVRHHPEYALSAMLLIGWLASRLGWEVSQLIPDAAVKGNLRGRAHARRQDVELLLESANQDDPGLAGVTIGTASGRTLSLDRAPGGLQAEESLSGAKPRRWQILGASRGEGGILGEGIRQALLRDPTYRPALKAARALAP